MQVAHDVATEAHLPNPQVVGDVGDPATAIITAARHHQAEIGRVCALRAVDGQPVVADALIKERELGDAAVRQAHPAPLRGWSWLRRRMPKFGF